MSDRVPGADEEWHADDADWSVEALGAALEPVDWPEGWTSVQQDNSQA